MIDVNLIPEDVKIKLAKTLLPKVQEYFKDENHQKEFEEWKIIRNTPLKS